MYLIDAYLSPLNNGAAPTKWYLSFALLLLAYQTLDGSDGKQARRTKTGSALGELMDHGVDAVATAFAAAVVADATQFSLSSDVVWICVFGGQMTFCMSNLTLLHRGRQQFNPIDIMELQWVMITTLALAGVFGTQWWIDTHVPVPFPEYLYKPIQYIHDDLLQLAPKAPPNAVQARFIIAFGAVTGTISNFCMYLFVATEPYRVPADKVPEHVKRNAPGTGLGGLLHETLVVIIYGVLAFMARARLADPLHEASPETTTDALRALLFGCSFAFGDLMDRILVMRVAHHPLPTFPPTLVCMHMFAMGAMLLGAGDDAPRVAGVRWWWILAAVCVLVHMSFFASVSRKLAKALGIRVFRIPFPPAKQS